MNANMTLNQTGRLIDECWREIPQHFANIELADHVVMPNHIHGIIVIRYKNNKRLASNRTHKFIGAHNSASIPVIVRAFKAVTTRRIRAESCWSTAAPLWQRGYYEHVIRNADDFDKVAAYIRKNPLRWGLPKHQLPDLSWL